MCIFNKFGGLALKKIQLIVTIFLIALIGIFTCLGVAHAETDWDIKVDLIKHNIVLKVGQSHGLYDNKTFKTIAPIKKSGSIYMPVQLISDLKLAKVTVYDKNRQVIINLSDNKFSQGFVRVKYKANAPYTYFIDEQGKEYDKIASLKPFIWKGNFYIPLSSFQKIFNNTIVTVNKYSITINSSGVNIDTKSLPIKTEGEYVDLNVCYDDRLYLPQIGGEYAMSKNQTKPDMLENEKSYKAFTARLPLKSGKNYFMIVENKAYTTKYFVIERIVQPGSFTPIEYFEAAFMNKMSSDIFEITNPKQGYLQLNSSATLQFKAALKEKSIGDNIFTLKIRKLINNYYQNYKEIKMPVINGKFGHDIEFPQKGDYLIEVISPKYIQPSGGSSSTELWTTKWAEFRVNVK